MKSRRPLRKIYADGGPYKPEDPAAPDYGAYMANKLGLNGTYQAPKSMVTDKLINNGPVGIQPVGNVSRTSITPNSAAPVAKPAMDLSGVTNGLNKVTPYLSNLVNGLRRPPAPIRGRSISPVNLQKVDFSNERADIDRGTRSANTFAANAVDGQSAAAINGANTARNFEAKGNSYAREAQMNSSINNEQARINTSVDSQNAATQNKYNDEGLQMKMAYQRAQSENLANAADKRIGEQNRTAAMNLDKQKFGFLSQAYGDGILDRMVAKYKAENGVMEKAFGGKLQRVYANGGLLDPNKPVPTYKTQGDVDKANMAAKDFALRHPYDATLLNPEDTHVATKPGDPVVQYEKVGPQPKGPTLVKAMDIPNYVKVGDIQSDGKSYWYEDPQQGNSIMVDPSVVNHPRFRKSAQVGNPNDSTTPKFALGGKLAMAANTPRLRGKLTKVNI